MTSYIYPALVCPLAVSGELVRAAPLPLGFIWATRTGFSLNAIIRSL